MKKTRFALALLLTLLMLCPFTELLFCEGSPFCLHAKALIYGELNYKVEDDEVTITGVTSTYNGTLTIPSYINSYPVTTIGKNVLYGNSNISKVILSEGIKVISENAFSGKKLASITLPSTIKEIGSDAFSGFVYNNWNVCITSLESYCKIKFANNASSPFYRGYALLHLNNELVNDLVIPKDISYITDYAFINSQIHSLTLENGVTGIGKYTFSGCKYLSLIHFSDSLINIDDCAFSGNTKLTEISFPQNLSTIGTGAFSGCNKLVSISLSSSIRTIGKGSFAACTSLRSVEIEEGLEVIEANAFNNCDALSEITLPESLQTIGEKAFYDCGALMTVTIKSMNCILGEMQSNTVYNVFQRVDYSNVSYTAFPTIYLHEGAKLTQYRYLMEIVTVEYVHFSKKAITPASCTTPEITTKKCSVCQEVYEQYESAEALGHDMREIAYKDSTCTQSGNRRYYECKRCTGVYKDSLGKQLTAIAGETISAKGHSMTKVAAVNATCIKTGLNQHYYCTRCECRFKDASGNTPTTLEAQTTPLGDHKAVVISAVAATCTKTGLTQGEKCSVCGIILTQQKTVPATGHTNGATKNENVVNATCITTGSYDYVVFCTVCKTEISRTRKTIEKQPHTPIVIPAISATCLQPGSTAGIRCGVCGTILSESQFVPANGHSAAPAVTENTVNATCMQEGSYDLVVYCSVCRTELSRTKKTIGLTEHTVVDIPESPAQCDQTGLSAGKKCRVCDKVFVEQTVLEALGHKLSAEVNENRVEPTCAKVGSYDVVIYCSVCKKEISRETKEIVKKAHTPELTQPVPATCTETGLTSGYRCSVCGFVITAPKTINAKGHTPSTPVKENELPSTCTAQGIYDEVVYCIFCKEELSKEQKYSDLIEHTKVKIPTVSPTCTETGLTEGEYCSVCKEVFVPQQTVTALGHEVVVHEGKPANCTENGWEVYETCQRKGCTYNTYKEITAKGHTSETDATIPVSCTENGLTEGSHCSVCKIVLIKQEVIPATGHKWDNGIVIHEPKIGEAGQMKYLCTLCKEIRYEDIPALPEYKLGDIDGDNAVTASDARLGLRCSVGLELLSTIAEKAADIDKDGRVTASDARLILRASVGLETIADY